MTGTRYHFCHTIISRVALAKPPSQNHPSNPPRCRVSILKITISRRSPSFYLSSSFSDFFLRLISFPSASTSASDALRFLLSSVSVLGNGPDVWRNTRNPIATLHIAGTSSSFLLIYETRERRERRKERTTRWEIKRKKEKEMWSSGWFSSSFREQEFSKMHPASFLRAREVAFCRNIVCGSKASIMMKVFTKLLLKKVYRDMYF